MLGKGDETLSLRRELQERMEESKATIKKLEEEIALVTARYVCVRVHACVC